MRHPLRIVPGATFRQTIEWRAGGMPVDLTGCVATLSLFDRQGAALPDASIAIGPGSMNLFIADEDTALLGDVRSYRLQIGHPNGDVTILLDGPVIQTLSSVGDNGDVVVIENDRITLLTMGLQGPPGVGGSGAQRQFSQAIPVATWSLLHNFGRYPAAITCFDTTGQQILGEVENFSLNEVRVYFGSAQSGLAILN